MSQLNPDELSPDVNFRGQYCHSTSFNSLSSHLLPLNVLDESCVWPSTVRTQQCKGTTLFCDDGLRYQEMLRPSTEARRNVRGK